MKFLEKLWVRASRAVDFHLGDGSSIHFDANLAPPETREELMLHGAAQKIGDASSGFAKVRDYNGAREAMQNVVDNLYAGKWRSDGSVSAGNVTIEALAEYFKTTLETAGIAYRAADEEKLKAWLKHPGIKAAIARGRAERAEKLAATAPVDDISLN